jgi:uncharacterized PurR-regulated membrane protein YhhQ (DUF165 family)
VKALAALFFVLFVGCVVAANWAVEHYGLVSVGFGLTAPAGVYFAGLAFSLRDLLHEAGGRASVLLAILVGAGLSYFVEDVQDIAVASAVAFSCSELLDLAIYTPLRERGWLLAVVLSNLCGLVLDSVLFLWIAFGSLEFLEGQVVGKAWMTLLAIPILWAARSALLPRHA